MNSVGVINKLQAQHETDTASLAAANAEIERLRCQLTDAKRAEAHAIGVCGVMERDYKTRLTQANATVGRLEAAAIESRDIANKTFQLGDAAVRRALTDIHKKLGAALAPPAAAAKEGA